MEKKRHLRLHRICNMLMAYHMPKFFYMTLFRLFRIKPILDILTVQLVDHCNLNCSGCSHFSPLADEFFADINQYDRDMRRLSNLMADIKKILLLGGEPLLHPSINMFLDSTRSWFPKASISLLTNGILLSKMSEHFWESCRRNSISLYLTLYPPLFDKESDFMQLAKSERVKMEVARISRFRANINSKGNPDLKKNFEYCRKWRYFPILKDGKVYPCAKPVYMHYFNKVFGTNIPNSGSIDLYDPKVTGWKILSHTKKSSETCRFCTYGWEKIPIRPWSISSKNQEEWDIAV